MRLLILSFTSGMLSYLSVSLPHFLGSRFAVSDDMLFFLPGVLFALFVLLPLVNKTKYRVLRWFGLLAFSLAAWYMAVTIGIQMLPLVKQSPILSCAVGGSIGVLVLAAASRYLVPVKFKTASILTAITVGFIGGCLIGMAVKQPRASMASETFYFIGFLFWHCSVAVSLFGRLQYTNKNKQMNDTE